MNVFFTKSITTPTMCGLIVTLNRSLRDFLWLLQILSQRALRA